MPSYYSPPASFDAQLAAIDQAAHASAFGFGKQRPSDAMCNAGNYKVGRVCWEGLNLIIEQPKGSVREKCSKTTGKRWRNVMAAHYGAIAGTKGADGDAVDCFIGAQVNSDVVFVVNQGFDGVFDEHKVMLCFGTEQEARSAYLGSYETGWRGLQSIVKMTLSQFHWWLKYAHLDRPADPQYLPYNKEKTAMKPIAWNSDALPKNASIDQLMYDIRRDDAQDGLLVDSATMADILSDPDNEAVLALDALVTPFSKLENRMGLLRAAMDRVGGVAVKTQGMQVSDPFKQRGTAQVAVVYELSDGQTISVYLHNPDADPRKIDHDDELISWKWMLNKKDVTIVVAPEHGKDLNVREVARRMMRLADKNSAAFSKANAKRAERSKAIEGLKSEVGQLEGQLQAAEKDLELAKLELEEFELAKLNAEKHKPKNLGMSKSEWEAKVYEALKNRVNSDPYAWIGGGDMDDRNLLPVLKAQWDEQATPEQAAKALQAAGKQWDADHEKALKEAQESEKHYSDVTLEALRNLGWTSTPLTANSTVSKEFEGMAEAGDLSNGARIIHATYSKDPEKRRYITAQYGWKDIFEVDGRDREPADVAKEVNDRVNEFVEGERAKLKPAESQFEQAKALVGQVAAELVKLGWQAGKPNGERVPLLDQYGRNQVVIEPDSTYPGDIEVDGSLASIKLGDDPVKAAYEIDLDNFSTTYSINETKGIVDDEDNEFFGKPIAFVYGTAVLEEAAHKHGCVIVWGDFNGSLATGSLFDSATHYGVSAQIGKDGRVIGRAEISEAGEVTLYSGAAGDVVALDKEKSIHEVSGAIKALVEAMPPVIQSPEPKLVPVDPPQPEKPDTMLSRLAVLRQASPKGDIYDADPNAIDKLRAKVAYLEGYSEFMRAANKLVRKNDRAGLIALGMKPEAVEALFKKDFAGRIGFPDYELKNNNANARRLRLRLQQLESQKQSEPVAQPVMDHIFASKYGGDTHFDAWVRQSAPRYETAVALDKAAQSAGAEISWFTPAGGMPADTLDSAMAHAISALGVVSSIAEKNAPIHAQNGDAEQAALSADVLESVRHASQVLSAFDAGKLALVDAATLDSAVEDKALLCGVLMSGRTKVAGYVGIRNDGKAMIYKDMQGQVRTVDANGHEHALVDSLGVNELVVLAIQQADVVADPKLSVNPEQEKAMQYLQSVVDGKVDPLKVDFDNLEAIHEAYGSDAAVAALFEMAAEIVANAALAATV